MNSHSEAFSRILIDKALEYSGWNLLDAKQVAFEYHNVAGRADYLLKDSLGRVLCVLEAKREDHDPYDAKEQGRGYAENLKAPFVILSNGREPWFWNLERATNDMAYYTDLFSPNTYEAFSASDRTISSFAVPYRNLATPATCTNGAKING